MTKKGRSIRNEGFLGYTELKEIEEKNLMKNIENTKHMATITEYTKPSQYQNIEKENMLITYGLDVETESRKGHPDEGQLRLMGIAYPNERYAKCYGRKTRQEYVEWLANFIWHRTREHKSMTACLVSWNSLDGVAIYRTILESLELTEKEIMQLLPRYGHVEGRFNGGVWELDPVIKTTLEVKTQPKLTQQSNGDWVDEEQGIQVEFGILQVINGSICFFIRDLTKNSLQKFWMFDVSALQKGDLQSIADTYNIPYVKGEKQYHIVDWNRFADDLDYRGKVLQSNCDDAHAVRQIADAVAEHFSQIFVKRFMTNGKWSMSHKYPNGYWSSGTLTVFALSMSMKREDFKSLNWTEQLKDWLEDDRHDQETIKDLYNMSVESFKAGLIEEYARGTAQPHEKVWVSDITSAYPFIMQNLYDLRYSVITRGTGQPEAPKWNEYLIARIKATDVSTECIHSVGVKEPRFEEMKIHPGGDFIATALYEEIVLLEETGATVEYLEWVKITTNGQPHPLAKVITKMFKQRQGYLKQEQEFKEKMKHAKTQEKREEYRQKALECKAKADTIKLTMNSIYGKTFEATRKFVERSRVVDYSDGTEAIENYLSLTGFKAGQLFNPVLATLITGLTRVRLVEKANEIQENGGNVIMALTDAIHWFGDGDEMTRSGQNKSILARYNNDLANNGWTPTKTLGQWEKPQQVFDYMCVGNGRYQYRDETGKMTLKLRGMMLNVLNYEAEATDIQDEHQPLKDMVQEAITNGYRKTKEPNAGEPCIRFKQRIMGNVAYAMHKLDWKVLARINEVEEEAIITRVFPKRQFFGVPTMKDLATEMRVAFAPSIYAYEEAYGKLIDGLDGTLPILRERVQNANLIVWETEKIKAERNKNKKQMKENIRRRRRKELAIALGLDEKNVKALISSFKDNEQGKTGMEMVEELAFATGFTYSDDLRELAGEYGVTLP